MDDLEQERWAHLIDGLIKGEYVELLYPNVRRARYDQKTCIRILQCIDLPFEAGRSVSDMWVKVSGMIRFLPNTSVEVHCRGWRPR